MSGEREEVTTALVEQVLDEPRGDFCYLGAMEPDHPTVGPRRSDDPFNL